MNTFEQFKTSLLSLGMVYRNKYTEWPDYVILGTKERNLVERQALSLMKPSEVASGKVAKDVLGFKIIQSTEPEYFAVAKNLVTEDEYNAINQIENTGSDLFQGDNLNTFLNIPLEKILTTKGAMYGIVLHNTERNPTIDAYSELNQAYDFFNEKLFNGELPKCLLTFQRESRTMGYLARGRFVNRGGEQLDELALNPSYFGIRSIAETLSTLVHEQCHKWQWLYGKPSRPGYHNHDFAKKMESIGLMTSQTGLPGGKRVGQQMDHYIIKGGPFELACEQLLSTQFSLSWYDRFPPTTLESLDVKEKLKPIIESLAKFEQPLKVDPELLEFKDAPSNDPEVPKVKNKSNRVKYQCPTCKTNMWGAANKTLLCGEEDCNQVAYVEIN